jgi:hypothetical protein
MVLSEAGLQLVLDHEVGGGRAYYDRFLSFPTVPGFESGVTVGIGFDLGYTNLPEFDACWGGLKEALRLRGAVGLKQAAARQFCATVTDIRVPWEMALNVFLERTVPTHWLRTLRVFPQAVSLPEDCASVLFSIVFNRGMSLTGERRSEMRGMKDALANSKPEAVPGLIRSMKRLWPEGSGLVKRREAEAKLFEAGLRASA